MDAGDRTIATRATSAGAARNAIVADSQRHRPKDEPRLSARSGARTQGPLMHQAGVGSVAASRYRRRVSRCVRG